MSQPNLVPEVYISYAWEEQDDGSNWPPILQKLYKALEAAKITIHIDAKTLQYKDNIQTFMKEIGKGKYIICIISEKYIKSKYCMYEVLQVLRYPNYKDRIFPIIISDAKIYNSRQIVKYLKFWEEKIDELNNEVKTLSDIAYAAPIVEDIEIMYEIRRCLAKFGDDLSNMNALTPQAHRSSNFKQLIESILKKFEIDKSSIDLTIENLELKEDNLNLRKEIDKLKENLLEFQKAKILEIQPQIAEEKVEYEKTPVIIDKDDLGPITIPDFNNFLELTKDGYLKDAIALFGKPEIRHLEEKFSFNNARFFNRNVKMNYYKSTERLMGISISGMGDSVQETISYLENKGITDEKIYLLGKHKDYILNKFGTPLTSDSDNYTYEDGKLLVRFICYKFNHYLCNEVSIHFRNNDR